MTIAGVESSFIEHLNPLYVADEARNMAWLTINQVCKISRSQFLVKKQETLSQEEQISINQILNELKKGKPLQYVLGETEFYGLPFRVNPSVLIPRPETEELVDWILKTIKTHSSLRQTQRTKEEETVYIPPFKIIDIGTGSGCIPVVLKKNVPHASIFAVDVSTLALETAMDNAVLNGVKVQFIQDDILNLHSDIQNSKFDVIVSNPPYVRLSEQSQMHVNVLDHEPHLALFVPDDDALLFYDRIVHFASTHLNDQGCLFFEINESLGQQMIALLIKKGFTDIELRKDLRGKDRMIKAVMNKKTLLDDQVILDDYDEKWPKLALVEMESIKKIAEFNWIVDVQHIGSTAIVGLKAKPIIDIMIGVESISEAAQLVPILESIGYVFWDENPKKDRLFFVKGMPPFGKKRSHHVHVFETKCYEWTARQIFRDYLNAHHVDRMNYQVLKIKLAKQFVNDREAYTAAKSEYVKAIVQKALKKG